MHTQPSYEPVPCNAGSVSETVFLFAAKHTATTVASCSAWGARRGRRSQCRRRWRPPRRTQRRLRGGPRPARPRSAPRAARAGQQPRRLLPRQVQVDASDSTDHRDALAPCCVTWLCRRSCTAAFLCYSAPCRLSLPGCAGRRASTEKLLQGGSGAPSMDTARRATPAGAALRNCSEQTMTAAPPSARRAHSSCVVAGATGADAATSCQVGTLAARQHACRCLRMLLLPVEGSWECSRVRVLVVAPNARLHQKYYSCTMSRRADTSCDIDVDVAALSNNRVHGGRHATCLRPCRRGLRAAPSGWRTSRAGAAPGPGPGSAARRGRSRAAARARAARRPARRPRRRRRPSAGRRQGAPRRCPRRRPRAPGTRASAASARRRPPPARPGGALRAPQRCLPDMDLI